jgi:hypothetical protein
MLASFVWLSGQSYFHIAFTLPHIENRRDAETQRRKGGEERARMPYRGVHTGRD